MKQKFGFSGFLRHDLKHALGHSAAECEATEIRLSSSEYKTNLKLECSV